MKNFDEIINNGVIRWTEAEKDSLINHAPDGKNGVFKIGRLMIIVTTEHIKGAIVECISVSRLGNRKPNTEEIEIIKELFWGEDEAKVVSRLFIKSDIIHLRKQTIVKTA